VLNYYWPNAISYNDITKTDFTIHRGTIDILTGGFPCQPYSAAGKRLGKEDDRHLWPEMLRAIREIQPTYVVGENVRGLTNWNGGMVFNEVQADLEAEGYEVTPFLLPACAVNAPHRRDRIWFIARFKGFCGEGDVTDTNSKRWKERGKLCKSNRKIKPDWDDAKNDVGNPEGSIMQGEYICRQGEGEFRGYDSQSDESRFITDTKRKRSPREEYRETESGQYTEKSQGIGWSNFRTQSPICNGDDGLSSRLDGITFPKWRNESIKAGGNAIVPQIAYQKFKSL
jgi:DNA (cytosine-5)-methyltransferase 1